MKMRNRALLSWTLAVLIALVGAGCGDKKGAENPKPEPPKGKTPEDLKNAMAPDPSLPEGLPLENLPANLKAAAFEYYGLGNPDTVRFKVTSPDSSEAQEGTQTLRLTEVGENEAKFTVAFGGALLIRGNQEVVLKPDGIYVTKLADKQLDKPMLELPNDLTPGKTWNSSVTIDGPTGDPVEMSATFKVKGSEKLKTEAGEFDAIRVDGTMTAKSAAGTVKSPVTGWYAKGTGQIKFVVKGVRGDAKDPKQTMTVEIAK